MNPLEAFPGGAAEAREMIRNLIRLANEKRQKSGGEIVYGKQALKLFGVPLHPGILELALAHLDAIDPEREAKVDRAIIAFGDAVAEHDDACRRAVDSDGDGADVQASIDSRRFMEHERDALRALLRPAPPSPSAVADKIVRDVAELPDRDSPEDWPEAMLVTGDELRAIVLAALAASNANARGGE